MPDKILNILRQRREELLAIETPRKNWSRITEWHARTRPLIAQHFKDQLEPFDKLIAVCWAAYPRVISRMGGWGRWADGVNSGGWGHLLALDRRREPDG